MFVLKVSASLEVGASHKYLGRILSRVSTGFTIRIQESLFRSLAGVLGLSQCRVVPTPGVKSEAKVADEDPLEGTEPSTFRSAAGKQLFISHERAYVQYAMKEMWEACGRLPRAIWCEQSAQHATWSLRKITRSS